MTHTNGSTCPSCKSTHIRTAQPFVADWPFVLVDCTCLECSTQWRDRYRLDGTIDLQQQLSLF